MTRLCHTVLSRESIEHSVYIGSCRVESQEIPLHFWIELLGEHKGYIVDYRLGMWMRDVVIQVPHGIFKADTFRHVSYQGEAIDIPYLPEPLFQILSMSAPLIQ
ncbi:hypothetical protein C1752_08967 [Acaryochloris thomasi RCC1774]|uniref:Uncharacterized protein n=1 Tax=Acaryochloris thomasi RCC1774 TaxID=1764569 RepID=A0A2W1JGS3_9CYAN|nr:hypothetical protein [Acaryochloris thomasi]PZD70825.1 hypothetical protein C1752_08967 [Acaryochloris thomasi RCC1774]